MAENKQVNSNMTEPKLTEKQIRDAFAAFGYEPNQNGMNDVAYWSIKPESQLETLYENLKARREEENKRQAEQATKNVYNFGEAFFTNPEKGALIMFTSDIDGDGPANTSTVWHVDPKTKKIRPILSEAAFMTATGQSVKDVMNQGLIKRVSTQALNPGGVLAGFTPLTENEGIRDDGTYMAPKVDNSEQNIKSRYGKQVDEKFNTEAFKTIDGLLNMLKGDSKSGISSDVINAIAGDPTTLASYMNAFAYGGYNLSDIFRDIKRRELVKQGRTDLANVRVFDTEKDASTFFATPEGSSVKTNPDLTPPRFIGDIDTSLFDNPIFKIPAEAYSVLVQPFDWTSEAGQEEMNKIKTAFHDVVLQQLDAQTERDKVVADYNYKNLTDAIAKKYGLAISANANEAWNQINNLDKVTAGAGIYGSGIAEEAMDKYLSDIREKNKLLRENQATEEEYKRVENILKYGTSDEIAALSDEDKVKFGLKPTQNVINFFSKENLKKQYPNLSDEQIDAYRNSIIDENGNYRSDLYQTLYKNKYGTMAGLSVPEGGVIPSKKAYQLGSVQVDEKTGEIIGGTGALYNEALKDEKAYKEFTEGGAFEKPVTSTTHSSTPVAPAKTPSMSSDSSTWTIANPAAKTPSMSSDSSTWTIANPKAVKNTVYDEISKQLPSGQKISSTLNTNPSPVAPIKTRIPGKDELKLYKEDEIDRSIDRSGKDIYLKQGVQKRW